jgi:hypothetical protein
MQTFAPATNFSFGRRTGAPLAAGEAELIPESLVLLVRLRNWGYVWNWPLAVSVTRNGRTERKAVIDATRLALWSMGFAALVMALGLRFLPARR